MERSRLVDNIQLAAGSAFECYGLAYAFNGWSGGVVICGAAASCHLEVRHWLSGCKNQLVGVWKLAYDFFSRVREEIYDFMMRFIANLVLACIKC